jgi:hypothetical protein
MYIRKSTAKTEWQLRHSVPICPSGLKNSGPNGQIFEKFYTWNFYQDLSIKFSFIKNSTSVAVAQLVEALRYKPEGRGFDSRWCHWDFSLT